LSIFFLPIIPNESWKPSGNEEPVWHILKLLTATIGLPFFIVSTTSPLVQAWFSTKNKDKSPYQLYALSNLGSLLALISYPFLFEQIFKRHTQAVLWSIAFGIFAILYGYTAWKSDLTKKRITTQNDLNQKNDSAMIKENLQWQRIILWFIFPMFSCIMLLSITNKLCQDVASIPFLWILPLTIYLFTFILSFSSITFYNRWIYLIILNVLVFLLIYIHKETHLALIYQILIYSALLFLSCMILHGELFSIKPEPENLTLYYLMISLGGAAGGIFVGIIAVKIFNLYTELFVGVIGTYLFLYLAIFLDKKSWINQGKNRYGWIALVLGFAFIFYDFKEIQEYNNSNYNQAKRNFYGVLKVYKAEENNSLRKMIVMVHGNTYHGFQYLDDSLKKKPTSYFSKYSGAGVVMTHFPKENNRRVGVIGLGVGTLAAYGRNGDYYKFYEINQDVIDAAKNQFTFTNDSLAKVEFTLGDARLTLEKESNQNYDILFMDAFSSDSIPVHLLTKEVFAIYLSHLREDGVITVNATNHFIDIIPIVSSIADFYKLNLFMIDSKDRDDEGVYAARFLILTKNKLFIERLKDLTIENNKLKEEERITEIKEIEKQQNAPFWTDDFNNLFQVLKWK
jgi:spermidine synthase